MLKAQKIHFIATGLLVISLVPISKTMLPAKRVAHGTKLSSWSTNI
jgi:hypothetical protein